MKNIFLTILILLLSTQFTFSSESSILLKKGWNELVKDNDTSALQYFQLAYEKAQNEKNIESTANALLNIGICSYGVSYNQGLQYCLRAMNEFDKLKTIQPQVALTGRSKCLQLISTIKSRQGKFTESIALSKEARDGFNTTNDTTGFLGLIYNGLGRAYSELNKSDSSEFYHRLALTEWMLTNNMNYLPTAYLSVAEIEMNHGNKTKSWTYYNRALVIADSTSNRQALVSTFIGIGKWFLTCDKNERKAEENFLKAKQIAFTLSDKYFYLKALQELLVLKKQQQNFKEALIYGEEIQSLKDTLATWEKERITRSLEIQFDVAEKGRQLSIVKSEKDIASLTNYLLWGTIGFLILMAAGIILFLKKMNNRDKQLLKTKEELVVLIENQKEIKEQQMQNELEFKESQLSAVTFQMLQKNELLTELKERVENETGSIKDSSINKLINKGLNHDKEWSDFNTSFESLNKNFYSRLKQAYPDISPNDLKICALIKMNLSIKDMAGILNISPDSVKTARYRLRKKLQLNTEDNLTDFILNLK